MTASSDRIFVSEIECFSAIGVTASEREKQQKLIVDVEVKCDLRKAAGSDSINDALDYGKIEALVIDLAGGREYKLLETLAELISSAVLGELGGESVRVFVRKPDVRLNTPLGFVAVEVSRGRFKKIGN